MRSSPTRTGRTSGQRGYWASLFRRATADSVATSSHTPLPPRSLPSTAHRPLSPSTCTSQRHCSLVRSLVHSASRATNSHSSKPAAKSCTRESSKRATSTASRSLRASLQVPLPAMQHELFPSTEGSSLPARRSSLHSAEHPRSTTCFARWRVKTNFDSSAFPTKARASRSKASGTHSA